MGRKGRGRLWSIRVDYGPEFTSKRRGQRAYGERVELDFIRPGKPTDNADTESFDWKLRSGGLHENWLRSSADAQAKLDAWRSNFNGYRSHSAFGNLAPYARAETCQKIQTV